MTGYFGEMSKGAHELLDLASEGIAEKSWVEAGATSLTHAKAIQKQRLYRTWGVTSVREVARIKLEGLNFVGVQMAPPPGFDMNSALNQARDEAYARAARGTDGSFGIA